MKITSLDIRKQEFNRSFRGYDMDEVDSFLQVVATQWQEMVDDLRRSGEKITEQQLKLDHYMKVEEALEEALRTARSSARVTIENAEHKAKRTLEEAENRVVELQKTADSERLQMKRDTAKYAVRQQEIVAKLRAFLMSEMEILGHFDAENIRPALVASSGRKEIELVKEDNNGEDVFDETTDSQVEFRDSDNQGEIADSARAASAEMEEESSLTVESPSSRESQGDLHDYDEDDDFEDEDDFDDEDDFEDDDDDDYEDDEYDDDEEEDALERDEEGPGEEAEEMPSWRVTPVFGSDGTPEKDTKLNPAKELDDEAEAEIQKIHQILKDLDDE